MNIFTEKAFAAEIVREQECKDVILQRDDESFSFDSADLIEQKTFPTSRRFSNWSVLDEELEYYTFFTSTVSLTPYQNYIVELYQMLVSQGLVSSDINNIAKMEEEINRAFSQRQKKEEFVNDYSSEQKIFQTVPSPLGPSDKSPRAGSPLGPSDKSPRAGSPLGPSDKSPRAGSPLGPSDKSPDSSMDIRDKETSSNPSSEFSFDSETVSSYGPIRQTPKNFCSVGLLQTGCSESTPPIKMYLPLRKKQYPKEKNGPRDPSCLEIVVFPYVKFYSRSLRGVNYLNGGEMQLRINGFMLWVDRVFQNNHYQLIDVFSKTDNTFSVRATYFYQTEKTEKYINVDVEFYCRSPPRWKETKLNNYAEKLGSVTKALESVTLKLIHLEKIKLVSDGEKKKNTFEFVLNAKKIPTNIVCISVLYSLYQFCEKNKERTKGFDAKYRICSARAIMTAFNILGLSVE